MKKLNFPMFVILFMLIGLSWSCKTDANGPLVGPQTKKSKYKYKTVPKDAMNVKLYTLDNGLRIYMSVNKDAPRIQTFIATRAGSKNDPADATGLAHYLEHMLFKGTSNIGSLNWNKEKVLLKEISDLYEAHFKANDEERKEIYKQIDSVSSEAAKLVASNEYDKLITKLGAKGTNAYTSLDQTVYINDIPSNELDRWLKIESERFNELVLRLFHTELEAVYEEFNIGQSSDGRKVFQAFMSGLLPNHPYGTQTTIGTSEHLKRPSMLKIHEYFKTYYVPNNMAIVLAGDFDPDNAVDLIKKHFGEYKSKTVPEFEIKAQPEIKTPIIKEVIGREKEVLDLGWRLAGAGSEEAMMGELVANILSNGKAGLIDINLVQKQKVANNTYSFSWSANDFSFFGIYAYPRSGQKLEELKDLVLAEVDKIRKGQFPDWMIDAVVTDLEYRYQKSLEDNQGRANRMLAAFIADQDWSKMANKYRKMRSITKEQLMEFANTYLKDNNYVVVYKREGEDNNLAQVEKPSITPVEPPKDTMSAFRAAFEKTSAERVDPVFVDFKERIQSKELASGITLDYIENQSNQTFSLNYILDMGSDHDKILPIAVRYLKFLGTDKYSAEELQQEFFKLGVSFDVYTSREVSYVTLRGLDRSLKKGVELFEHILANAQPNEEALKNLITQIKKDRNDAKKDKRKVLRDAMFSYARYGKKSPFRDVLSSSEMDALLAQQLVNKISDLTGYKHTIFYYGTKSKEEVTAVLNSLHQVPKVLLDYPPRPDYKEQATEKDKVVFVPFPDMSQAEIMMVSKGNQGFNVKENIMSQLYNEYFGYGLSSVVFQEIREKRALAYSAYAYNSAPQDKRNAHYFRAYVGTQTDKLPDAVPAMKEIIEDIPINEDQLTNAVDAILKKVETDRLTGDKVYWAYRSNKKRGFETDLRKEAYDYFSNFSAENNQVIEEFKKFHKKTIKDRKYTILVLGDKNKIDKKYLKSLGDYEQQSIDELYGY